MMSSSRPKWIQSTYDEVEHYRKHNPHKLTKREFMRGMMNGKCNRVSPGTGESDSDLQLGEVEKPSSEAPEGTSE